MGPSPPPYEQIGGIHDQSPSVLSPSRTMFAHVYKDLTEVFSETESDMMLPHCLTDCAIEILPGAKLPKPKMYPMMPKELDD